MIQVLPLHQRDLAAVAELFNRATADLPFRWQLDPAAFRELVLLDTGGPFADLAADAEGWLVARAGRQVVGFVHCSTGRLHEDEADIRRGFLRFMIAGEAPAGVAQVAVSRTQVAAALVEAADAYFSRQTVAQVHAFHIRTGYTCYLAGRGMLAGRLTHRMAALGQAGYRISDRWLLYESAFRSHQAERLPSLPGLSLHVADSPPQGFSLHVTRQAQSVARLAVEGLPELSAHSGIPSATLRQLIVELEFRRKGVGRWLLGRAMNESITRGFQRLVVDINHADGPAQGLLLMQGFEELPVRGYSYEKEFERAGHKWPA